MANISSEPQSTSSNRAATSRPLGSKRSRNAVVLLALTAALGVALFFGRGTTSNSLRARTDRIAADIKCPTCQGLSVADSKAPSAKSIYAEIERQLTLGRSDADVRGFLVSRYGEQQLLRPTAKGIGTIVWAAPIATMIMAFGGLALAFQRAKNRNIRALTGDDELLVANARAALRTREGTHEH
jgi:cytochrome c-type biogenesis protein CcmH/NrfF